MELLIGLGIGALIVLGISSILSANLKSSLNIKTTQIVSSFSQELLDSVRLAAEADWHNINGLTHGNGTTYYFANSSTTSSIAISGRESVFANDVNSGIIGYWKFDEATGTVVYDSSWNFKAGSFSGSPTRIFYPNCKAGNCLSFNGTTDYVSVPMAVSGTDGTISFWVKNPAPGTGNYLLRSNANIRTYFTISAGNQVSFYKGDPAAGIGSATIIPGNWSMLTLTWRNDSGIEKGSSYINGIPIATDVSFSDNSQGSYVTIAGFTAGGTQNASGIFDDVRVYDRALSLAEVQQLYGNSVFTRSFYIENIGRDQCGIGDISANATTTCASGPGGTGIADDPLTQKITVVMEDANNQVLLNQNEYVARLRNYSLIQTNWSGGGGQSGVINGPNDKFDSSFGVIYSAGIIQLQLP